MPDEIMKLLTLDRWGRCQSCQLVEINGDELELGKMVMNLNLTSRKNGEEGRRDDVCIEESLAPVGIPTGAKDFGNGQIRRADHLVPVGDPNRD